MRSHSVTCHPAEVTFPPLPQPKLVLDLATPEGCKAELTWVRCFIWYSQDGTSVIHCWICNMSTFNANVELIWNSLQNTVDVRAMNGCVARIFGKGDPEGWNSNVGYWRESWRSSSSRDDWSRSQFTDSLGPFNVTNHVGPGSV